MYAGITVNLNRIVKYMTVVNVHVGKPGACSDTCPRFQRHANLKIINNFQYISINYVFIDLRVIVSNVNI